MTTMNISLPESMRAFVEAESRRKGFGSVDQYLQSLVEAAQRQAVMRELEAQLLEGINSGARIPVDDEYWARKEASLRQRHGAAHRSSPQG